jgi:uncharacterized protein YndB with AHSA1/START domain
MSTNTTTVDAPANTPFIDTVRDFDAAPERVFRAFTDPELVAKWLGPRNYVITIDTFDARPGGRYRYIHTDTEGNQFAFRGVFHDVQAPLTIIQTFEFEGYPGQVSIESMNFEDLGGRTRISQHSVFPSVESRDMIVASGMEGGLKESMDRLEELLAAEG